MDSKSYSALSARQIADGVKAKKFSAVEVAQAALERAHQLDPKLKAFVTILKGLADVAKQPSDIDIEIIDYDILKEDDGEAWLRLSPEGRAFVQEDEPAIAKALEEAMAESQDASRT